MQAYKLKGKIDQQGHLILTEPVNLTPGDVEVIILQPVEKIDTNLDELSQSTLEYPKRKVECSIPILSEWFEQAEPVPPDFDPDQAKWEYLKEKHNL